MLSEEMLDFFLKLGKEAKNILNENTDGKEKLDKNYFNQTSIRMDIYLEDMVKERIKEFNFRLITEEKPEHNAGKTYDGTIILDPLDGSKNYERNFPAYAFAIAGSNSVPARLNDVDVALVLDLSNQRRYYSIKGKGMFVDGKKVSLNKKEPDVPFIAGDFGSNKQIAGMVFPEISNFAYMRMLGAATLDMANAATGIVDGYVDVRGQLLVTHSAGVALMQEAGLTITDRNGKHQNPVLEQETIFNIVSARTEKLHRKLLDCCKDSML